MTKKPTAPAPKPLRAVHLPILPQSGGSYELIGVDLAPVETPVKAPVKAPAKED